MKPSWSTELLPSGERRFVVLPLGSPLARVAWWGLVAAMFAGSFALLAGVGALGWLLVGVSVLSAFTLLRNTTRREAWVVKPGSAERRVEFLGSARSTVFSPVQQVRITRARDVDAFVTIRLELVHAGGKVEVGPTGWDDDERVLSFGRGLAEALGVPVEGPAPL